MGSLIDDFKTHMSRLKALDALPYIEVIDELNTRKISMNWDFDPYFDYKGMLKSLQLISVPKVAANIFTSSSDLIDEISGDIDTSLKICDRNSVMNAVFSTFQSTSLFLMNSTLADNHAEYLLVDESFNRDKSLSVFHARDFREQANLEWLSNLLSSLIKRSRLLKTLGLICKFVFACMYTYIYI